MKNKIEYMESLLSKMVETNQQINRMTKMFEKSYGVVDKPSKEYYEVISLMNEQDYLEYEIKSTLKGLKGLEDE